MNGPHLLCGWNAVTIAFTLVLFSGCAGSRALKPDTRVRAATLSGIDAPGVIDGRMRFREIFCELLDQHRDRLNRGCEELLHRFADEPLTARSAHTLPEYDTRLTLLFVPGLFSDCASRIALPFETSVRRLRELGYRAEILSVSGRSSSGANADRIAEQVARFPMAEDRSLVLIGHSKGAVDILEFIAAYPRLATRVAAVVSVAGAINGSPLGDAFADFYRRSFSAKDLSICPAGDGGGLESLRRATRLDWLASHPLPISIRYFSVGAFTGGENVSPPLRPFAAALARIDPRNDGQLLFYDQVIPGSALLAYANADHWAIAVPIEEKNWGMATFVTRHNYFPRDVLIEAVILYLSEQSAAEPRAP